MRKRQNFGRMIVVVSQARTSHTAAAAAVSSMSNRAPAIEVFVFASLRRIIETPKSSLAAFRVATITD